MKITADNPQLAALLDDAIARATLVGVEFGYRQCERGRNLSLALELAKSLLKNDRLDPIMEVRNVTGF